MKLVVDAEVVFAALMSRGYTFGMIKRLSDEGHELLAPDYLQEEIERRKDKIQKFSGLTTSGLDFVLGLLFERIKLLSKSKYQSNIKMANSIAPHPVDIPYFALALATEASIWSNEKGFKKQKKIKVYSTKDIKKLITHST